MSKFVKLDDSLLDSQAWRHLTPGAKVLYIELKRRFNGSNNGDIFLSHRDAADIVGVVRNTVARHFKELQAVGLITAISDGKIGPSGIGKSPTWELAELPKKRPEPVKPEKVKRDKTKPPKFTPPTEDDDALLDDEIGF